MSTVRSIGEHRSAHRCCAGASHECCRSRGSRCRRRDCGNTLTYSWPASCDSRSRWHRVTCVAIDHVVCWSSGLSAGMRSARPRSNSLWNSRCHADHWRGDVLHETQRVHRRPGEVGGSLGINQDLTLAGVTSSRKTPNMLTYSGNVVVSLPTKTSFTPYATGGVGGLSLFERAELRVTSTETFFTGNVGGGVKWYAPNLRPTSSDRTRGMHTASTALSSSMPPPVITHRMLPAPLRGSSRLMRRGRHTFGRNNISS